MATTTSETRGTTQPRDDDGEFKAKRRTDTHRTRNRDQDDGYSTGALIGAAAAGVAVGIAALVGRKFAVQAPTALAGEWDEALKAEHKAVLLVFDKLQATDSSQTTKRTMMLAQMKHALGKHAFQEENVVYPTLRDNGHAEGADELNREHGYVKQYLHDLEKMPKDSPMFLSKLAEFRRDIEEHMQEEENRLFPALKAELTPEENKLITAQMNKEGLKLA